MATKLESLFARRAIVLAQPKAVTVEDTDEELICFKSGTLLLGVRHSALHAIVHGSRLVSIAGLPRGIVGLSAFKGEITSVLDFGLWSGVASPSTGRLLVVLHDRGRTLGLRIDELVDSSCYATSHQDDADSAAAQPSHCISRVTPELVSILDVPALFDAMAPSPSERHIS